jgi:uncharacterized protein (TIGR03435 family)
MAIQHMRHLVKLSAISLLSAAAFSQSTDTAPIFEASDIHLTPLSSNNRFMRGPRLLGDRYELKFATMVDLISIAYGIDPERIVGGPNWLEMTRFDVVAKAPPKSTAGQLNPALKQLLAERFKLVTHSDSRQLPSYTLVAGKKPLLKESDGTGETGCKPQSAGGDAANGGPVSFSAANGADKQIALGPGRTIQYVCRNMTMAAFAAALSDDLIGPDLGPNPVVDQTALEGRWNFEVRWSLNFAGPNANPEDRVTVPDAIEKQLGLKLEMKQLPTPVVVVDRVNEQPTPNAPDVAEKLKIPVLPAEFEVAAIKPAEGKSPVVRSQVQPGGRVVFQGQSLRNLIQRAWGITPDMLVGAPGWLADDQWDILAKVSTTEPLDIEAVWPLVRKLLADRFGLKTHIEDRPAEAYNLVATKPKLKKADPATRTHSQNTPGPDGKDPRVQNPALQRLMYFQNYSMAQFAEQLQRMAPGYIHSPVLDKTGLEGAWDFTLAFSTAGAVGKGGRGGRGGDAPGPDAADPGMGLSLSDAMEKQLGLKLESVKRPVQVLVIDHIDRKPTDN